MAQAIKDTVVSKTNYEYETFDVGNKALVLDETKSKDVFAAIDQLGLKGQEALIKGGGGSLIPFPKMTAAEQRVWEEYCPEKKKLIEYSATLLPFEILTFLTLIDQHGYFHEKDTVNDKGEAKKLYGWIEVWSESREDIDPLIVGRISTSQSYGGDNYLLGRWGISLRKYEDIVAMVKESWKAKRKATAEAVIATLDHDAHKHFAGDWVQTQYL